MSIEIDYYISKEDVKAGLLHKVSQLVEYTRRTLLAASRGHDVDPEAMIRSSLAVCANRDDAMLTHLNFANERMRVRDIMEGKIAA